MGLILFPGFLAHAFFESKTLVISLKLLVGLLAFHGVFVLHDATHACNGFRLKRVSIFLGLILRVEIVFLANLLVGPVLLVHGVNHHAFMIH